MIGGRMGGRPGGNQMTLGTFGIGNLLYGIYDFTGDCKAVVGVVCQIYGTKDMADSDRSPRL
ncbi:MAG: hypothetical protein CMQ05_00310 [Gammaproteobacteria bacterium]|nr:hypothetical protein [Gammaproteobacteria bacterium]